MAAQFSFGHENGYTSMAILLPLLVQEEHLILTVSGETNVHKVLVKLQLN